MTTKYTCYRTAPTVTASGVAAFFLAAFPFATLLALVLWGDWLVPFFLSLSL